MSDLVGQELGHYAVTSRIGRGGMGEVLSARDRRLGRDVAVKVLEFGLARALGPEGSRARRRAQRAIGRLTIAAYDSSSRGSPTASRSAPGRGGRAARPWRDTRSRSLLPAAGCPPPDPRLTGRKPQASGDGVRSSSRRVPAPESLPAAGRGGSRRKEARLPVRHRRRLLHRGGHIAMMTPMAMTREKGGPETRARCEPCHLGEVSGARSCSTRGIFLDQKVFSEETSPISGRRSGERAPGGWTNRGAV